MIALKSLASAFILLLLLAPAPFTGATRRWTEKDESRRIEQLKMEERRMFERELGGGSLGEPNGSSGEGKSLDYGSEVISPPHHNRHHSPSFGPIKPIASHLRSPHPVVASTRHWCFSCTSPWKVISSDMQQVIRNWLDVRRAEYPQEAIVDDCADPKHLDALPREHCQTNYCQTLVLTDHDAGKSLAIRGCAEHFGASVSEKLIAKRGDNTCKKLHPNIDIHECICSNRKYCYAGPERRNLHYTEESPAMGDDNREEGVTDEIVSCSGHRSLLSISTVFIVAVAVVEGLLRFFIAAADGYYAPTC